MTNSSLHKDIRSLLFITLALLSIGLVFVYSASSVFALEKFGTAFFYLKKQIIGAALGLTAFIFVQHVSVAQLKRITPFVYFVSLLIVSLTLFSPLLLRVHGSSRWLSIAGFSFQPSEILKIAFVLFLSLFLSKKKRSGFYNLILPLLIILLIPSILLLKQPDFGATVTLFLIALFLLIAANISFQTIFALVFPLLPLLGILVYLKPYRLQRVITFINPWADPKGSGFQIIQSLIAIGSGGLWGVGIAQSKQKFFYLPMQHTDFIFSIIAEESGFIGSLAILILFLLFLYFGLKIAQQLHDKFSELVVTGFVSLICLQAGVNIAVAAGLIPTKGIGLPFVSYGNSALVCNLFMVGIIFNLAKKNKQLR